MANRQKRIAKETRLLQKKEQFRKRFRVAKHKQKTGLRTLLVQLSLDKVPLTNVTQAKEDSIIRDFQALIHRFSKFDNSQKLLFIELVRHPKINFEESFSYHLLFDAIQLIHTPARKLASWKAPKSKSDKSIFKSLYLHLFVAYRLPAVVQNNLIHILYVGKITSWKSNLLFGLAEGNGLHHISGIPFACNSKMNFHLCQAPDDYSLEQALAWAKLRSSNTGHRVSNVLARKLFKGDYTNWPTWIPNFLGFIQRNPAITARQINRLLSFIVFQKEQKYLLPFPEVSYKLEVEPLFPNFSFKGRTISSALNLENKWKAYLQILRETRSKGALPPSPTKPFTYRSKNGKVYTFRQIGSIKDLIIEGKRMNHCVATYSKNCLEKVCSIWAVQIRFPKGLTKNLLTIELVEATKHLEQIQGMCNRNPSKEEMEAIKAWATKETLSINDCY